jgi:hypothetical protein
VSTWARVRYRVTQFGRWILDAVRPVDRTYVDEQLDTPELVDLFTQMSRADQHHGIAVARTLARRGTHNPDLIAAALLHDVGKSRVRVSVWARVMVVLGEWLLPDAAARWGRGDAEGLTRAFVVRRRHAAWGAEMADRAGASAMTVQLIRSHHDPDGAPRGARSMLAALHAADEE